MKGRVLADALKAASMLGAAGGGSAGGGSAGGGSEGGGAQPEVDSRSKGVSSDLQSMEMPDLSAFEEPVQPSLQESELRYLQQLAQRLFPDG